VNKSKIIPAKVGTQSWLIIVDGRSTLKIGKKIRFKEPAHGSRWQHGIVDKLEPILFLTMI